MFDISIHDILRLMKERNASYQEYIDLAYNDPFNITYVSSYITIQERELREFWKPTIDRVMLSGKQYFSLDFIREHKDDIRWELINHGDTEIDPRILYEFYDKLNLHQVLYQKFDEDVIEFLLNKEILTSPNKDLLISLICSHQDLSEDFIERYKDYLDWTSICHWQKLSEPFMEKYKNYLDWDQVSANQELSEEFMDKYEQELNWELIHSTKELSRHYVMKIYNEFMTNKHYRWLKKFCKVTESFLIRYWERFKWEWDDIIPIVELSPLFINTYGDEIDRWDLVSNFQSVPEDYLEDLIKKKGFDLSAYVLHTEVSEDFLRKHFEQIDKKSFWDLTISQQLSESFIREFADYLDLSAAVYNFKQDTNFFREYQNKINFKSHLFSQPLDEKEIEEFGDKLDWDWVSQRCHLSEKMILKYSERINWKRLDNYQHLSKEFIEEHFEQIFVEGEIDI